MKPLRNFFIALIAIGSFASITPANAQEAPDVLIKRISTDVVESAKADQEIHAGNQKRVLDLVEKEILPYVDFQRMTALAAGRYWRQASPEQQKQLIAEFRALLVYTYSGAISQIREQTLEFKPLRADPSATEVEVRSQVMQTRGEPAQLSYRLEKTPAGWRIFDVNVLGAWLVQTYKSTFASEISKSGIDGLIKTLSEKNKRLAGKNRSQSALLESRL
ncbi:ABC transporter substrate-binding protein [Rhodanobacter sp. T12-5]|uniref:MlaC/ttg2D family ABC transporter substrate-binding protein n=1 Tax=Rhodanobacter sp. T12-5 TaxID=2024611 RepID=UPI0011EE751D|nr:ABC transporter substrate-binding protein [Rhodanobacter sp. T12-5]KAA0068722.1 ABC transporter substrate-binding protein [Rhodanobacter sp. T12-5]